jgi:hypothetical protein
MVNYAIIGHMAYYNISILNPWDSNNNNNQGQLKRNVYLLFLILSGFNRSQLPKALLFGVD